jgi:prephenate dehydrogenase
VVLWKRITLVGVGLLGGSLGLAVKKRRLAKSVIGFVRRAASVDECLQARAVDEAMLDLPAAVAGADLIVLCTPLAQMRWLVEQMLGTLKAGTVVTDVGSVKGSVVRELEGLIARAGGHFVGSHPMAGAEKTGVRAARADLFENAICVVTPTRKSEASAVRQVEALWRALGSQVIRMSPPQHDQLVSRSSHLPHLVAAGLANFVLNPAHPKAQSILCANGFRDTTRIASGSPEMWRDIAVANRQRISGALSVFIRDLRKLERLIAGGKARQLERFLVQAKTRRDRWQRIGVPRSPE